MTKSTDYAKFAAGIRRRSPSASRRTCYFLDFSPALMKTRHHVSRRNRCWRTDFRGPFHGFDSLRKLTFSQGKKRAIPFARLRAAFLHKFRADRPWDYCAPWPPNLAQRSFAPGQSPATRTLNIGRRSGSTVPSTPPATRWFVPDRWPSSLRSRSGILFHGVVGTVVENDLRHAFAPVCTRRPFERDVVIGVIQLLPFFSLPDGAIERGEVRLLRNRGQRPELGRQSRDFFVPPIEKYRPP